MFHGCDREPVFRASTGARLAFAPLAGRVELERSKRLALVSALSLRVGTAVTGGVALPLLIAVPLAEALVGVSTMPIAVDPAAAAK